MKSYEALAAVYDRLGNDIDYEAFADFYEARFLENGERPSLVLDLGCGTGKMTTLLAERGYDMIGVDASAEMLSHAASRAYSKGHRILFLEQDMREFELYGTVGAVVSSLDCINYLVEDGDVDRCFSLVHNYLDPNGLFPIIIKRISAMGNHRRYSFISLIRYYHSKHRAQPHQALP